VPPGFAHGFFVLKDNTEFLYKTTDYYAPQHEHCIRWDDPVICIEWSMTQAPILSGKDQLGLVLSQVQVFED
jgi:dTDP-4-dehydrorhamnose 3,5-epimerase